LYEMTTTSSAPLRSQYPEPIPPEPPEYQVRASLGLLFRRSGTEGS